MKSDEEMFGLRSITSAFNYFARCIADVLGEHPDSPAPGASIVPVDIEAPAVEESRLQVSDQLWAPTEAFTVLIRSFAPSLAGT